MGQKECLAQCVADFLDSKGWNYVRRGDDNNMFVVETHVNCMINFVRLVFLASDNLIQSVAIVPIKASEAVRANVAEYITRINFGKSTGRFEMDYSDGEVRSYSYLLCSDGIPPVADVEQIITMPLVLMRRYGDGLAKTLMGAGTPEENAKMPFK